MRSPEGWLEPGQRPDFDEYTVVLDGWLRVEHEDGALDVRAGQAVLVPRRRVGPLLDARRRRLLRCRLPARVRAGHGSPRRRVRTSSARVLAPMSPIEMSLPPPSTATGLRDYVIELEASKSWGRDGRARPAAPERDGRVDHARARAAHAAAAAARHAPARPRRPRPGAAGRDERPLPDPQAPQRDRGGPARAGHRGLAVDEPRRLRADRARRSRGRAERRAAVHQAARRRRRRVLRARDGAGDRRPLAARRARDLRPAVPRRPTRARPRPCSASSGCCGR